MLSVETRRRIASKIRSIPEFRNATIVYVVNGEGRAFDPPPYLNLPFEPQYFVVIEEVSLQDSAAIEELERWTVGNGESPPNSPTPIVVTNRSKLGPELIGAGLSCGLAIVSAVGVFGGVAAEVATLGSSTYVVLISWAGLVSGGVQCINGLVRVREIAASPDDDSLERWDKNKLYKWSFFVVDAIGVASGIAALPALARNLFAILARQRSFIARGLTLQRLQAMNRDQRLQTIIDIFEEAARTPKGREALVKAARDAGITRDFHAMTSGLSVQRSVSMVRAISVETTRRLSANVAEIVGTAVGTVASALPKEMVGSASGSINDTIEGAKAGAKSAIRNVKYATTFLVNFFQVNG